MAATEEFEFSDDPARVDLDSVWAFLSTDAYWGRWRTREIVEAQVRTAWRVVGCYAPDGAMVAFARTVSDGLAIAYLADLYVAAAYRGRGLGHALVEQMVERGPGAELRWLLHTADAHELYREFGFAEPGPTLMERPAGGRNDTEVPIMTDPEPPSVDREDLEERAADVVDEFDRELPVEADDLDALDQRRDLPDTGEDDYPS